MFEMLKIGPRTAGPRLTAKISEPMSSNASRTYAVKKALMKSPQNSAVKKSELAHLIPVLQRLQPWMHPKYKLCYECLRFRRKDLCKERGLEKNSWTKGGVTLELKKGKLSGKEVATIRQDGAHCPECSLRRKLDVVRLKGKFKEWSQIINDTVGLKS